MARRDVAIFDRADPDALQSDDGMADRVEHVPHLTLASFMNRELDRRLIG
jgi:hypothetical protein